MGNKPSYALFFYCIQRKCHLCVTGVSGCSLPVDWDGEYHDSSDTTQDITFTQSSNYVVGWGLNVYSSTITSWTCIDEDTSNNFLLFQ